MIFLASRLQPQAGLTEHKVPCYASFVSSATAMGRCRRLLVDPSYLDRDSNYHRLSDEPFWYAQFLHVLLRSDNVCNLLHKVFFIEHLRYYAAFRLDTRLLMQQRNWLAVLSFNRYALWNLPLSCFNFQRFNQKFTSVSLLEDFLTISLPSGSLIPSTKLASSSATYIPFRFCKLVLSKLAWFKANPASCDLYK